MCVFGFLLFAFSKGCTHPTRNKYNVSDGTQWHYKELMPSTDGCYYASWTIIR